jgi:glycosyltransferase involved in cell wall biosynthesis
MSLDKSIDLILIFYNNNNTDFVKKSFIDISKYFNKVILIDNGSSDGTAKSLRDNFENQKKFIIHEIKENIRYGGALKRGFLLSDSDYVFWSHGDTIIKNEFYEKSINLVSKNSVFIKGLRRNRMPIEYFFTRMLSFYASLILGTYLKDISAFPCAIPKASKDAIIVHATNDYSIELFVYYFAELDGLNIQRVPVEYLTSSESQSTWSRSLSGYLKMIRLWSNSIKKLKKYKNEIKQK